MPRADARASLPCLGLNAVGCAAFHVPHERLFVPFFEHFPRHHDLISAAVTSHTLVIKVGSELQSRVGKGVKGQHCVVEIDHGRVVFVDQIHGSVVESVAVSLVRQRHLRRIPVPFAVVFTAYMPLFVEVLWVKTVPPCSLSVGFCQATVVRLSLESARSVGSSGCFIPRPCMGCVHTEAQRHSQFAAGCGPTCYDVLLRSE